MFNTLKWHIYTQRSENIKQKFALKFRNPTHHILLLHSKPFAGTETFVCTLFRTTLFILHHRKKRTLNVVDVNSDETKLSLI